MEPYYEDADTVLYQGDMREVLPDLDITADCVVADPPYGETSLSWDRWPDRWPDALPEATRSMWCFGSMRMFLERALQFGGWKLSQDVVWNKGVGTSMAADRFKRVHEFALHWYRGRWDEVHHAAPREKHHGPNRGVRHGGADRGEHFGSIRSRAYEDNGTRLLTSIQQVPNMHGKALHPTEKPPGILAPLIEYACPPGGLVLDPFAGSGSTAVAARLTGRRAVLIEADERYCEVIARRLAQGVLPMPEGAA
jgi:site-specific DNA-methyltransferase (adenine-specific)